MAIKSIRQILGEEISPYKLGISTTDLEPSKKDMTMAKKIKARLDSGNETFSQIFDELTKGMVRRGQLRIRVTNALHQLGITLPQYGK